MTSYLQSVVLNVQQTSVPALLQLTKNPEPLVIRKECLCGSCEFYTTGIYACVLSAKISVEITLYRKD